MATGCGDVLSLEDLKIAKLHQLFEAEVITGRQGGVATGAEIDYATNQVTGQSQKTLPAVLREAGYVPVNFNFKTGGTLNPGDEAKIVLWPGPEGDGSYYSWRGAYPKVIPANSTPATAGGVAENAWVIVNDTSIFDILDEFLSDNPNSAHDRIKSAYVAGNLLKVSTWNIQSYQVILARYGRDMTAPMRFHDLSRFIFKEAPHVLGMQEAYDGPSAHMSNLVVEPFVDSSFGPTTLTADVENMMTGYRAGNAAVAAYDLSNEKVFRVVDEGGYTRLAVRSVMTHPVLGTIAVYNVHGSWFQNASLQLYNAIVADYKSIGAPRVIVMGDFNHDTAVTWFSPFTADGFTIVNNLAYDTRNDGGGSWYIDNIIVKGFTVQNVSVTAPDPTLADHKMLTAVLKGA